MDKEFNRLKEIEDTGGETIQDGEILDLMEEIAERENGLTLLVGEFGASSIPIFTRTISFCLATQAKNPTEKLSQLIFQFLESLLCREDESTLLNCLTAIQRQIMFGVSWAAPPPVLLPFLMHCLMQSILVQTGVFRLLAGIYETDLLSAFTPEQKENLRQAVLQQAKTSKEIQDDDLSGLQEFLLNKP